MQVVQTVFGVFHHFELARQLEARGYLQRVYSTWPWARLKREGIPQHLVETFPWIHTPEVYLSSKGFQPRWLADLAGYQNAIWFDRWTSRRLRTQPPPDALIALSGSSLRTGRELQDRGTRFICDRGSSHQRYQDRIVSEEYQRWGVDRAVTDPKDTAREEAIYAAADAITVPSSFAARSFAESGVDAAKVHVLPYGVSLEQFAPRGEPRAGQFDLLFAGSVGLRKGFPYAAEAFARVRHPQKRFRVAGAIHPDLKAVLPQLPLDGVEFLGPVSQERLAELMSTSHLMVLPSIEEGLALVQGQALACGCPVLASTNTGAEDLFCDEREGFIVPIRDVEALRDRMQRIADNPGLQERMREAALRRVSSLGGWDDYGSSWERLLLTLTGHPPPTN